MDNNKIWRTIVTIFGTAVFIFLLWYFRTIVVYVAIAAVIGLVGRPIMHFLAKLRIGKVALPKPIAAIITIFFIFGLMLSMALLLHPLVSEIMTQAQVMSAQLETTNVAAPIDWLNEYLIDNFPRQFNEGFRIETTVFNFMMNKLNLSSLTSVVSSFFSIISSVAVALFSVVFISFFFLTNEGMISRFVISMIPDQYGEKAKKAFDSSFNLLSRYFIGIILECLGIFILNSLGLLFIVRLTPSLAIVIALITAILNVIPYIGPLIGHCVALVMAVVTYMSTGLDVSFFTYLLITFAVTMTTQLVDNYLFQPLIYSSSVKAHPLEIFIVILMAGHIGGMVGMLVAIPCYTVLRVIASEFLQDFKLFRTISRNI
ncbi:MAG: AI-2E family transporter [Bacteroidales bacterium]|nr:AI-2E family transporter [Bacteroidales bacterium]